MLYVYLSIVVYIYICVCVRLFVCGKAISKLCSMRSHLVVNRSVDGLQIRDLNKYHTNPPVDPPRKPKFPEPQGA